MIHIYTTVEHKESLIEIINKNWNVKKIYIHIHVGFFLSQSHREPAEMETTWSSGALGF